MIFDIFVLFVAILISTVSAYYSITGLTAIFAANYWSIIIMGASLELGKITAVVWLHKYWNTAGWKLKAYLLPAIIILMLITSMGTYGYLARAHINQAIPTGDIAAKVALVDEKIKIQRENIATARAALSQMDAQVNARLDRGATEQGAERAIQIRRQQQPERNKLLKEISDSQNFISKLNEEVAPIASQLRKVEAEVGPIKYIAALIYGDNPDNSLLESAVRWVIILIVLVFDPLALAMMLAANSSMKWEKERASFLKEPILPVTPVQKIQLPETKNTNEHKGETKKQFNEPKTETENISSMNADFGPTFPAIAKKGQIFVRVDILPHRVFKFDGSKWIEIEKTYSDTYLHNQKYIQYLVEKIEKGEYDVELLSDMEKEQVAQYLNNASRSLDI